MNRTGPEPADGGPDRRFEGFFAANEPRLRAALVARFGPETGREAAADALGYGWLHWERVATMANPAGYLYRVGERQARRRATAEAARDRRERPATNGDRPRPGADAGTSDASNVGAMPEVEPGLVRALAALSVRQRQAVVLVAAYGLTHDETGALLGLSRSTVQNHLERGLAKLRNHLGVQL